MSSVVACSSPSLARPHSLKLEPRQLAQLRQPSASGAGQPLAGAGWLPLRTVVGSTPLQHNSHLHIPAASASDAPAAEAASEQQHSSSVMHSEQLGAGSAAASSSVSRSRRVAPPRRAGLSNVSSTTSVLPSSASNSSAQYTSAGSAFGRQQLPQPAAVQQRRAYASIAPASIQSRLSSSPSLPRTQSQQPKPGQTIPPRPSQASATTFLPSSSHAARQARQGGARHMLIIPGNDKRTACPPQQQGPQQSRFVQPTQTMKPSAAPVLVQPVLTPSEAQHQAEGYIPSRVARRAGGVSRMYAGEAAVELPSSELGLVASPSAATSTSNASPASYAAPVPVAIAAPVSILVRPGSGSVRAGAGRPVIASRRLRSSVAVAPATSPPAARDSIAATSPPAVLDSIAANVNSLGDSSSPSVSQVPAEEADMGGRFASYFAEKSATDSTAETEDQILSLDAIGARFSLFPATDSIPPAPATQDTITLSESEELAVVGIVGDMVPLVEAVQDPVKLDSSIETGAATIVQNPLELDSSIDTGAAAAVHSDVAAGVAGDQQLEIADADSPAAADEGSAAEEAPKKKKRSSSRKRRNWAALIEGEPAPDSGTASSVPPPPTPPPASPPPPQCDQPPAAYKVKSQAQRAVGKILRRSKSAVIALERQQVQSSAACWPQPQQPLWQSEHIRRLHEQQQPSWLQSHGGHGSRYHCTQQSRQQQQLLRRRVQATTSNLRCTAAMLPSPMLPQTTAAHATRPPPRLQSASGVMLSSARSSRRLRHAIVRHSSGGASGAVGPAAPLTTALKLTTPAATNNTLVAAANTTAKAVSQSDCALCVGPCEEHLHLWVYQPHAGGMALIFCAETAVPWAEQCNDNQVCGNDMGASVLHNNVSNRNSFSRGAQGDSSCSNSGISTHSKGGSRVHNSSASSSRGSHSSPVDGPSWLQRIASAAASIDWDDASMHVKKDRIQLAASSHWALAYQLARQFGARHVEVTPAGVLQSPSTWEHCTRSADGCWYSFALHKWGDIGMSPQHEAGFGSNQEAMWPNFVRVGERQRHNVRGVADVLQLLLPPALDHVVAHVDKLAVCRDGRDRPFSLDWCWERAVKSWGLSGLSALCFTKKDLMQCVGQARLAMASGGMH